MLNQLSQLTVDCDGRYATDEELSFLQDYIASAKMRTKAYKKLREFRSDIAFELEQRLLEIDPEIFIGEGKDFKMVFHRDQGISLKYTAATVLSGDLERLKQSLLSWYRTIISKTKPSKCRKLTDLSYQEKFTVICKYLEVNEQQYVKPTIDLYRAIIAN